MHLFANLFSNGCRSVLMITLYNVFHILVPLFCHKNRFSAACNVSCCNMAHGCMWMVGRSAEVSSYRPDLDRRQNENEWDRKTQQWSGQHTSVILSHQGATESRRVFYVRGQCWRFNRLCINIRISSPVTEAGRLNSLTSDSPSISYILYVCVQKQAALNLTFKVRKSTSSEKWSLLCSWLKYGLQSLEGIKYQ